MLLMLRTIANAFQEEGGTDAEWLGRVSRYLIMDYHVPNGSRWVKDCGDYRTSTIYCFEQGTKSGLGYCSLQVNSTFTVASLSLNMLFCSNCSVSCEDLQSPLQIPVRDHLISLIGKVSFVRFLSLSY